MTAHPLSESQAERYSRQLMLTELGAEGQARLLAGRVLVVGAGGLGSPASIYLAAAGVGTIGIVDSDVVDLSNLQRQVVHATADIGRPKVASAEDRLLAINPEIAVRPYPVRLTAENAPAILRDYDFVIDATDSFASKFLIADVCHFAAKPYSHAGILRFRGQTMTVRPGTTACYRCLFGAPPPPEAMPPPSQIGVLGTVPGVIGTLQAAEAIKFLLGRGELLTDCLLTYDALRADFRKVPVGRNPACPLCGDSPSIHAAASGGSSRTSARPAVTAAAMLLAAAAAMVGGCATPAERNATAHYAQAGTARFELPSREAGTTATATQAEPSIDDRSTVDDYVRYAFRHAPALTAAFGRWKAALERLPQARTLENPELTYEYSLTRNDFLHRFAVSQSLPWPGTTGWKGREALAEAEAAAHEFEAARLDLYGDVVTAFHEYAYLRRATAVGSEHVALLEDLERAVRTRYEAGAAAFSDAIQAQVELARAKNDLATLGDERAARSAALAALLGLPTEEDPLPWPVTTPSHAGIVDERALAAALRDLNPELKAREAMIERERAALELARRERYPELMAGASLMEMPGMDGGDDETEVGLMAGVTLPIWRGAYAAAIREAQAMLDAAIAERDRMENGLRAELAMALFKLKDAERRSRLFGETLVPKAEQACEVARQEFSAGKADLMTWIDAQRTLLDSRLMRERAAADRELAVAEIGCCIGKYELP